MAFVYALDRGNKKWMMKIESNKFISIRKTVEYFGIDTATKLPQIHAVTGCYNTCLYMLLACLDLPLQTKVKTGSYSRKEEESLNEVRVSLSKQMKTAGSQSLPPK